MMRLRTLRIERHRFARHAAGVRRQPRGGTEPGDEPVVVQAIDVHGGLCLRPRAVEQAEHPVVEDVQEVHGRAVAVVVHALAQYLDLAPLEKQALLECDTLLARAAALADLLEMRVITAGKPLPNSTH